MYIPYCGYKYALVDADEKYPTLVTGKKEGKYTFVISETPYLGYDDFMSVEVPVGSDTPGIAVSGINIYPNIWGDYEYYVCIMKSGDPLTENIDHFFMIEIDSSGNFIPYEGNNAEFNEEAQQILKDKNTEITEFMKVAKDTWGLEAKHDLAMGIKGLVNGQPIFTLVAAAFLIAAFCLILSVFIWLLKCKLPFQSKFGAEMDAVYGAEYGFKRTVGEYEFFMSAPQFLRNNGFLMIQKKQFAVDRISLVIYPYEKETAYFALINGSEGNVRKADKIKVEYIGGKVLCNDVLIREKSEETEDLIIQSSLFWGYNK